jgi:hypothetical protein
VARFISPILSAVDASQIKQSLHPCQRNSQPENQISVNGIVENADCQIPSRFSFGRHRAERLAIQPAHHRRTAMRLRPNEFCPIHRSTSCCGRELMPRPRLIRLGVQRIEDTHHPRGYRELRSPAEMRKLLNRKIVQQGGICAICHEDFTDYNDIVPDHRDPRGMGGAWRDDHPDNIQATHWWCNGEKGSTRIDD